MGFGSKGGVYTRARFSPGFDFGARDGHIDGRRTNDKPESLFDWVPNPGTTYLSPSRRSAMSFVLPALAIAILLLISSLMVLSPRPGTDHRSSMFALTPHDPIVIVSDLDFAAQALSEGWTGDGSAGDPYVIEGYEISEVGATAITISDTRVHFLVNGSSLLTDYGVSLVNVTNGSITNNALNTVNIDIVASVCANLTIWNNTCASSGMTIEDSADVVIDNNVFSSGWGIYFDNTSVSKVVNSSFAGDAMIDIAHNSDGNLIANNNCSASSEGVYIEQMSNDNLVKHNNFSGSSVGIVVIGSSDNNTIANNTCLGNLDSAITLAEVNNTALRGNNLGSGGLLIIGDEVGMWDSHSIDSTNTVNGKPLYYFARQASGTVPSNAGQVILANCTDFVVDGVNCSDIRQRGIVLAFSSDCEVLNSTFANSGDDGIQLIQSSGNALVNNNCSANVAWGIHLEQSDNNTLTNNNCSSNGFDGIMIQESNNNTVISNSGFWNVFNGVDVVSSRDCVLLTNAWSHNQYDGAYIGYSTNITMDSNNCSRNGRWGVQLGHSNNNTLLRNQICNNSQYGVRLDQYSASNQVFNNTFIGNNGAGSTYDPAHIQAYDGGTNNRWNTSGTPHGYGNYWSDWTSPDVAPADGIVDVNYTIVGGAHDEYPLAGAPEPIPEFGMMPLVVIGLLAVFLLAARGRKGKP